MWAADSPISTPISSREGWHGRYTGIDLVPGLLSVAAQRQPDPRPAGFGYLRSGNIDVLPARSFDFVVASGIFNAKLGAEDNHATHPAVARGHVPRGENRRPPPIFSARTSITVSPSSGTPIAGHLLHVAKGLSRRVILRCDYMPFEFCVQIFADRFRFGALCFQRL